VRLHWVAIIFGHVEAYLAITGGVHSAGDVIKSVMAGARVAMMASALLKNGYRPIGDQSCEHSNCGPGARGGRKHFDDVAAQSPVLPANFTIPSRIQMTSTTHRSIHTVTARSIRSAMFMMFTMFTVVWSAIDSDA
jgi:hypothetical protein